MFRRAGQAGFVVVAALAATLALGLFAAVTPSTGRAVAHARADAAHLVRGADPLIPLPGKVLPTSGGTAYSLNWSGYAVTPGSGITAVKSVFVVPTASPVPAGFAATWTGIGGYSTSDLIQAGTSEQSIKTNPVLGQQYYAWYELLPASETELTDCTGDPSCAVSPGEKMGVSIVNEGGDAWKISMIDVGHWTWTKTVTYASSGSSAEWILEAPTVGAQTILANTGTTHFGATSTYTQDGVTRTVAQGDPTEIILSPSPVGGADEATPSALAADGQSFNDCAYKETCPTP